MPAGCASISSIVELATNSASRSEVARAPVLVPGKLAVDGGWRQRSAVSRAASENRHALSASQIRCAGPKGSRANGVTSASAEGG